MIRSIKQTLAAAGVLTAAALTVVAAQGPTPTYKRDLPAKLLKQATVAEADAARTAASRVPNGRIEAVELENEGGRLIYSYELKVPGKSGIDEVNVDAKTGKMVGKVQHESASAEKAEAKAEQSEAKKAKKKP